MSSVLNRLSLIGFVTALTSRSVDPIIPQIAQDLWTDPETVALLITAFAIPFAIVQPILGPFADMFGKIRLMILCLLLVVIASAASAVAPNFSTLLATRIITGIATGGIFPVGLAIIGDLVPLKDRQLAIGRWLAVVITGNLLGASVAGLVADFVGWRAVFLVIAAGGAIVFVTAIITLGKIATRPAEPLDWRAIPAGYRAIFANPRAKVCFSAVFFEGLAIFGLFPFVALLLHAAGEARASIAGLVIGGFSIGGVVYTLIVRFLIGRWRPHHLMLAGGITGGLTMLVVAFDPRWEWQFFAFLGLGLGFYLLHGSIQVQVTELSATARGAATALHSLFFFLGHAAGPIVYSSAFGSIGPTPSIMLGAVVVVMIGIACWRLLREPAHA